MRCVVKSGLSILENRLAPLLESLVLLDQPVPAEEVMGDVSQQNIPSFLGVEAVDHVEPLAQDDGLRRRLIQRQANHYKLCVEWHMPIIIRLHDRAGQKESITLLASIKVARNGDLTADHGLDPLSLEETWPVIQRDQKEIIAQIDQ